MPSTVIIADHFTVPHFVVGLEAMLLQKLFYADAGKVSVITSLLFTDERYKYHEVQWLPG